LLVSLARRFELNLSWESDELERR